MEPERCYRHTKRRERKRHPSTSSPDITKYPTSDDIKLLQEPMTSPQDTDDVTAELLKRRLSSGDAPYWLFEVGEKI